MFRNFTRLAARAIFNSNNIVRNKSDDKKGSPIISPCGGLDKYQGRIVEERFFNHQDIELLKKIRNNGITLITKQCEAIAKSKAESAAKTISSKVIRESCCKSKYKNSNEESFFIRENNYCYNKLREKLEKEKAKSERLQTGEDSHVPT
ncbi:uncharacterized protein LOC119672240 [Teleopsis dalmanni]|uniref:uncharacterized protein LOC119672240 n=1 Tax=Teleopsis dalmanni TaxID=139649 RepID=UPI0018CCD185|nr:uncharacterized protein LOC119672240 [Teleopsis dalmanni]